MALCWWPATLGSFSNKILETNDIPVLQSIAQYVYSVAPIINSDDRSLVGTGFFVNGPSDRSYFVSARSVFRNGKQMTAIMRKKKSNPCDCFACDWLLDVSTAHLHDDFIVFETKSNGSVPFEILCDTSRLIEPFVPTFLFGYSKHLWNPVNSFPIARQGTLASPSTINWNGKNEGLISIHCYSTDCGAPIIANVLGEYVFMGIKIEQNEDPVGRYLKAHVLGAFLREISTALSVALHSKTK